MVKENKLLWSNIFFFSLLSEGSLSEATLEPTSGLGISQALIGLGMWLPFPSDGSQVFNPLGLLWDFSMDSEAAPKPSVHPGLPLAVP